MRSGLPQQSSTQREADRRRSALQPPQLRRRDSRAGVGHTAKHNRNFSFRRLDWRPRVAAAGLHRRRLSVARQTTLLA